MSPADYLLDNRADDAGKRFDALSAIFNPVTARHLDTLGVDHGWRCWDVGAGGPSVPCWLAARVGPTGYVLATDIDIGWITGDLGAEVEVRNHDVARDKPPGAQFDLVQRGAAGSSTVDPRLVVELVAAQRAVRRVGRRVATAEQ